MNVFLVIVAGFAVAIAVVSVVNGIDYVGLLISTLLLVGVGVLHAAKRARERALVSPESNSRVGSAGLLARFPKASRFLLAMASIAYGMAVISLLRPSTPDPSARWGWLLSEVHRQFGGIGVAALYFAVGTVLLLFAWHSRDRGG